MDKKGCLRWRALLVLVMVRIPSAAAFVTDGRRSLLQVQTACSVNFEGLDYSILTSKCKGPQFPPGPCCDGFFQLACPYADQISNGSTNCAETLFSYIDRSGNYTSGLFGNMCPGDKTGIPCPENYTRSSPPTSTGDGNAACVAPRTPMVSFIAVLILIIAG